ncbi:Bidirectional sugar transporter SWEET10 [Euphorbia peplus]|nr:Bidirectional sugar transporter SWEET10 [Euphorbia peplus]
MALHISLVFIFGLLGNITSFLVCLAPLTTFYQICKKKTSEGFQSIPYIIALLSAMLWLFYALFAEDCTLLITINSFTFFMETIFISIYLFYATKKDRMFTLKLFFLCNVLGFGATCAIAMFITHGANRVKFLGWICLIFALSVFVAPLAIVRKVIKTKSVEYMPFGLSLFLTISAIFWFLYGYLKHDYYVAIPNILGFLFGVVQMLLFFIYRKPANAKVDENMVDATKLGDNELTTTGNKNKNDNHDPLNTV